MPNTSALGGFAECGNEAKPLFCAFFKFFNKQGVFIYIDTSKIVPFGEHSYEKYRGYKIFIVNKTDSVVKLPAINSILYAVAEVYYKGKWHEIEYILYSWCGNSYHSVFLRPGEYWEDVVPKYTGRIKSKMRYKLFLTEEQYVLSNEVPISFNLSQLYITKDSFCQIMDSLGIYKDEPPPLE
ncbi:MAG: hypothetical protein GXO48_00360 [Chlorobi bacterium]|nr:hypothetical protein [Chlorobiota bacterium]